MSRAAATTTFPSFATDTWLALLGQSLPKVHGLVVITVLGGTVGVAGVGLWATVASATAIVGLGLNFNTHLYMVRWTARVRGRRKLFALQALACSVAVQGFVGLLVTSCILVALRETGKVTVAACGVAVTALATAQVLNQLASNYWRATGRLRERLRYEPAIVFLEITTIAVTAMAGLSIPLIVSCSAAVCLLGAAFQLRRILRGATSAPSLAAGVRIVRRAYAFGTPLALASLGTWLTGLADRPLIAALGNLQLAGQYAICVAIANLVTLVSGSLGVTLFPRIAAQAPSGSATRGQLMSNATSAVLSIGLPLAALLAVGTGVGVQVMKWKAQTPMVVAVLAVSAVLLGTAQLWSHPLIAFGRTLRVGGTTLVVGLVALALKALLLPSTGIAGVSIVALAASIAMLASYLDVPGQLLAGARGTSSFLADAAVGGAGVLATGVAAARGGSAGWTLAGLLLLLLIGGACARSTAWRRLSNATDAAPEVLGSRPPSAER